MQAKKSLGQHFLTSASLAEKIVRLSEVTAADAVLEIGPGRGILTRGLISTVRRVVAVEKDLQLAADLSREFAAEERVHIVTGDILEMERDHILSLSDVATYKVVANLPYNIGSQILFRFVAWRGLVTESTVMLQREVALRLVALPGSKTYGLLTVLIGLWATGKIVLKVPPGAFTPRPKVDSAVLRLRWSATPRFDVGDSLELFDRIVHAAFRARRKILRNTLSGPNGLGLKADAVCAWLKNIGINPGARAEELSIAQYALLARSFPVS